LEYLMTTPVTAAHTGAAATAPAGYGRAVTPSDSATIPTTRALYIGGSGSVVVDDIVGTVTYTGLSAGTILPIQVTRVRATGTTATSIVALY
jgi:hypothetical protein